MFKGETSWDNLKTLKNFDFVTATYTITTTEVSYLERGMNNMLIWNVSWLSSRLPLTGPAIKNGH